MMSWDYHQGVTKWTPVNAEILQGKLSPRLINCLYNAFAIQGDWHTSHRLVAPSIGMFFEMPDTELLMIKNFGVKTLRELREFQKEVIGTVVHVDRYEQGVRDGLSRAYSRPGDGDMGG